MSSSDRGPRQLAEAVLRALSLAVVDVPVPSALALFFDILYEASFRTERGQPVVCSLLWQEPVLSPPTSFQSENGTSSSLTVANTRKNSCFSYFALKPPLPFNMSNLLTLAKALEPGASALAVYGRDGETPFIHGLVNYGSDYAQLSPAEWESQVGACGSFRATILGPAHITVDAGLDYPIVLKRNSLSAHSHPVLRQGPVRSRLSTALAGLTPGTKAQLLPELASSSFLEAKALPLKDGSVLLHEFDWAETLERLWVTTLARILLKIRDNKQGGAVLITPNASDSAERDRRIKLPYGLQYHSLRHLLEVRGAFWMTQFIHAAKSLSEQSLSVREMRPEELTLPEPDLQSGPQGSDREVSQAIDFIAALARTDGLLLLTPQLELIGFGGKSLQMETEKGVYLAGNVLATESHLTLVPGHAFGPRCQAVLQQCDQDSEAIGFFLTQDGDLRAIMQHEEKIIVWDPVNLPRE